MPLRQGFGEDQGRAGGPRVDPSALPAVGSCSGRATTAPSTRVPNRTSPQGVRVDEVVLRSCRRGVGYDNSKGDVLAVVEKGEKPCVAARRESDESSRKGKPSLQLRVDRATQLFGVYENEYAPPQWSLSLLADGKLDDFAKTVLVYYSREDNLQDVKLVAFQREPVNIAMERHYDADALSSLAGYRTGAYARSNQQQLMPNIAIYCVTPVVSGHKHTVCHIINVIGYAFDSPHQKDYQYFFDSNGTISDRKWKELVLRMQRMWQFIFECAVQNGLRSVCVADVGGGAFAAMLGVERGRDYASLKQASFPPVRQRYNQIRVEALGRIPGCLFTKAMESRLRETLLVNAWDPWSMVGNGNACDNSLDGWFGRSTAMAVLCWPPLNPYIEWRPTA
eukprot:TRINITY_DN111_c0_g1_i1.p1 TRINITY_DN111_c0_g1~~TRINITY_DN111_c0_g1_i1.p1  ORF type:complete len:393 (-),score=46.25 TRINITY_DN111_c0_g1_i1:21-1199(-)